MHGAARMNVEYDEKLLADTKHDGFNACSDQISAGVSQAVCRSAEEAISLRLPSCRRCTRYVSQAASSIIEVSTTLLCGGVVMRSDQFVVQDPNQHCVVSTRSRKRLFSVPTCLTRSTASLIHIANVREGAEPKRLPMFQKCIGEKSATVSRDTLSTLCQAT